MADAPLFSLTDSAIKQLKHLMASEKDTGYFRVSILGGGCSGFQYKFGFEKTQQDEDQLFDCDGILVLIDDVSLPFLEHAQLDYVEELIGSSFKIVNPNATASCGCGSSFSV